MKTLTAITIIATLSLCLASFSARADDASASGHCADDAHAALAKARQLSGDHSGKQDHAVIECLVEAVAALDDKLQGLSDGSLPFEGQIYIPKGWVMIKPSASGAD